MRLRRYNLLSIAALAVAAAWSLRAAAEVAEVWEGQPDRIEASIAVVAPGELRRQLEQELLQYLQRRANTSIGSVWRLQLVAAEGELRHSMLCGLQQLTNDDLPQATDSENKRLFLVVRATPWGFELSAREFDRYVERWGPTIERTVEQRDAVGEQLFQLVEQTVAPVARIVQEGSNPLNVKIDLRGADLPPAGAGDYSRLRAGDLFQPVLVRTTREGQMILGSAAAVPWTYIEVVEPTKGEDSLVGEIRSATARPLGVRRGRTEAVAIGMRHDRGPSRLVLRARGDKDKPLAGYEVFGQVTGTKELKPLGKSNDDGEVVISPSEANVQSVFIKSDGVTLARLPIVPGAEDVVVVPLADDEMRLRAAARLSALREDIVDVVARRTILMARARQQIGERKFPEARELMTQLDELPGTTQYRLAIERAAQLMRTDDPQVQRRIDKLFSDTRSALGKFLNPQSIAALHEELRQAELQGDDSTSETDAS